MDAEHESGAKTGSEVPNQDDIIDAAKLSPASSFSSASSLDDFFQFDTDTLKSSTPQSPSPPPNPTNDGKDVVTSNASMVPTSPFSPLYGRPPPHHSPPDAQVMERSSDYDPARIPSSVFATKSSSPLDWSVASNESLFSIHVGNNSFSRDQFIMFEGDLNKSGEYTKSGELIMFGDSPTPPVKIVEIDKESYDDDKGKNVEAADVVDVEETRDDFKECVDNDIQTKEKMVPRAVSVLSSTNSKLSDNSKQSDASACSAKSFEFPILSDGMKSGSLKVDAVRQHDDQNQYQNQSQRQQQIPRVSNQTSSCSCFSCFTCCQCHRPPRCSCCWRGKCCF